jgi:hypothetical protein
MVALPLLARPEADCTGKTNQGPRFRLKRKSLGLERSPSDANRGRLLANLDEGALGFGFGSRAVPP